MNSDTTLIGNLASPAYRRLRVLRHSSPLSPPRWFVFSSPPTPFSVSSSRSYIARVKGRDNRIYESTEGSREGAANPDPTEASTDASVPTEASTDAAVPKDAPTDAAYPTEAPMDAAVIGPTVESAEAATELVVFSVPELSDKEEKEEVGEHDKEVCELSIDGQGCDNEEEERELLILRVKMLLVIMRRKMLLVL
ncbi:predicted protein [Arabidopsis lyrata subsp. lyrata]|uniref:Predicted protein n=1 Tax=Arabidopsis lyrata subsp. lyrata TaxID=81972 RepID=D7LDI4_ARALL|nr:predicted protein [Arabidopsis lyrata subsp. lyrata]